MYGSATYGWRAEAISTSLVPEKVRSQVLSLRQFAHEVLSPVELTDNRAG